MIFLQNQPVFVNRGTTSCINKVFIGCDLSDRLGVWRRVGNVHGTQPVYVVGDEHVSDGAYHDWNFLGGLVPDLVGDVRGEQSDGTVGRQHCFAFGRNENSCSFCCFSSRFFSIT